MYKFKRIHIELTNRCNFACEFCPSSQMTRAKGDMEFSVLKKALDEIAKENLTKTIFFHLMGEPLLYKDLPNAVEYAKSKGLEVSITTNGSMLTKDIVKKLLQLEVDHIIFSVQTPDAESFALRKAKIDFDKYKEQITSFIAISLHENIKTKITLSFLVTPFKRILLPNKKLSIINHKKDLCKYSLLWLNEILKEKYKNEIVKVEQAVNKMNMLGWNKIKITEDFMLETRVLGDWGRSDLFSDKIKKAYLGCCEGLTGHIGILWNGDVVFCCVDFDGNTAFGNLKQNNIKELLQKQEIQNYFKAFKRFRILHPYCQRCLGDKYLTRFLVRQLGSIGYFKIYRPFWEKRRERAKPILC